jgi:ribosome biogenesis GTP-binding protein YsxC/EngB
MKWPGWKTCICTSLLWLSFMLCDCFLFYHRPHHAQHRCLTHCSQGFHPAVSTCRVDANPGQIDGSRSTTTSSLPFSLPATRRKPHHTITGEQIVHCREFSLETAKTFTFLGSFHALYLLPVLAVPEIAFVGRSNVGKSSLLNCLSGQHKDIAVQSKLPGRTRGINLFHCRDKAGDVCIFTDLPGYGFAKLAKDVQSELSIVVHRYMLKRPTLKLIVVLIDPRRGPLEADYNMIKVRVEHFSVDNHF